MEERNVFAGPYLDRAGHLRADPAWLESALADPRSRVLPVWDSLNLVADAEEAAGASSGARQNGAAQGAALRAAFLGIDEIAPQRRPDLILLGRRDGTYFFAYEVESAEPPTIPAGSRFAELRTAAALLPDEEAGLLSYARAMVGWRRTHRHCGRCGAKTLSAKAGHVLVCTNPVCRHEQFPRLDPAIIVLVIDGDRVLLGRQASWPAGRYSTIAGFVEPGESLEDAVAREVHEETGIHVNEIEYHSSQPWPFPSSLMLGFTARAVSQDIDLRDLELEDARWFTREDIVSGTPYLPPNVSISFRLIEHWFDAAAVVPLRELHAATIWTQPRG
jgi:NAD+ diphosphatase